MTKPIILLESFTESYAKSHENKGCKHKEIIKLLSRLFLKQRVSPISNSKQFSIVMIGSGLAMYQVTYSGLSNIIDNFAINLNRRPLSSSYKRTGVLAFQHVTNKYF